MGLYINLAAFLCGFILGAVLGLFAMTLAFLKASNKMNKELDVLTEEHMKKAMEYLEKNNKADRY